jgi:hypothetical protein
LHHAHELCDISVFTHITGLAVTSAAVTLTVSMFFEKDLVEDIAHGNDLETIRIIFSA